MSESDKATKASEESAVKLEVEDSEEELFRSLSDKDSSAFDYELLTQAEVTEVIEKAKNTQLEQNLIKLSTENLPAQAAEILNTSNHF
jgi:hypothetical protein